jgi:glutaminase
LVIDEQVYRSESATGDRNRALAHLMRSAGSLRMDVEEAVDAYFQQCSVLVTATDLAVMASTLANGGVNPRTGEVVLDEATAEHVLTVMATCGMYDFSGEWLLRVGLPAKSGVSGGLIAVSPGQFGVGLHSPPLDERGNSVRAVKASEAMSQRFSLHVMHRAPRNTPSLVPARVSGRDQEVVVLALHGDIDFSLAERALIALNRQRTADPGAAALIIDLDRVARCLPGAAALLNGIIAEIAGWGVTVVTADGSGRRLLAATAELGSVEEALAHFERIGLA